MSVTPEILAPAGDEESLKAALAAGADAVYFGLSDGFNARARAANFPVDELPRTIQRIHAAGARAYVTLNTLVFDSELEAVERVIGQVARAGADAILVQDPAVALLAREICPDLDVHASTQMTLSSPEGMALGAELGCRRVVLPRELTIDEVRRLKECGGIELEVFIHGALCVSWSGQCLTSEAWGGRSANRGQCAQSCRLPYDLVVDGRRRELGEVAYLLSPRDLAAFRLLPDLIRLGVAALKIEGRQKGAQYVATAVEAYRTARRRALAGEAPPLEPETVRAMEVSFSRGFSAGFLGGVDHQSLVDGRFPKHRGLFVGTVTGVGGGRVTVASPGDGVELARGDGVVFDAGHPERDEEGGPVFDVRRPVRGVIELRFGHPGPDLTKVAPGSRVWKTADPAVARHVREMVERGAAQPPRRLLSFRAWGVAGEPLRVAGKSEGASAEAASKALLSPARGGGLDAALLREKLGRLGGTPFVPGEVDASGLAPGLHLPVSELNELRRRIVAGLAGTAAVTPARRVDEHGAVDRLYSRYPEGAPKEGGVAAAAVLLPLCRTDAQLDQVIAMGFGEVELDWMEMVGLERAVERARRAGLAITIATTRVQKPGEEGYDGRIARLEPEGLLVRHWGGLESFRRRAGGGAPVLHGDFSLNVTNAITARFLLGRGLATFTTAHDLDAAQVLTLIRNVDPGRVTVVLHHHIATFHTEHCVYAHLLSGGRDFRDCGRPCEAHQVSLRDRTGDEHPVVVDVGCRNTVFNARAQTAAGLVGPLLERGVRRFRVEFVRESAAEVETVLDTYRRLLAGTLTPAAARRALGALERFGVTSGTLATLR